MKIRSAMYADLRIDLDEAPSSDLLVAVKAPKAGRVDAAIKRGFDVVLSVAGLVLASPLWLLAIAAIWLEDRGPILYRQLRWGRERTAIEVLKFRTMRHHDDAGRHIVQAARLDPRVTAVGRVLRSTGLDELPQLVNILKGQMSLVGPRALAVGEKLPGEYRHYEDFPGFDERLSVRPGLTGLATVTLPKDAAWNQKFARDLEYVAHRSFWLDVRLVVVSLFVSVTGGWESGRRRHRRTNRVPS